MNEEKTEEIKYYKYLVCETDIIGQWGLNFIVNTTAKLY